MTDADVDGAQIASLPRNAFKGSGKSAFTGSLWYADKLPIDYEKGK